MTKLRCFISMPVGNKTKVIMSNAIDILSKCGNSRIKWVRQESLHITLKFLGDIDPSLTNTLLEKITKSALHTPPFSLYVSHITALPSEKTPRIICATVDGDLELLHTLQKRIDLEMRLLGFPRETRRFKAHITLGRIRDKKISDLSTCLRKSISAAQVSTETLWKIQSVDLMNSTHINDNQQYQKIAQISLKTTL